MTSATPLLGFCAWGSGVGKTTLLTRVIPLLVARGIKVSVIKHAHHTFDIDHPGKDSYRLRESGAVQMLLGSNKRWALMTELSRIGPEHLEQSLDELLPHVDGSLVDLILVEGFRNAKISKIEVFRPSLGHPLLAEKDNQVIAIATDEPFKTRLPLLDLNDPVSVTDFIVSWLKQKPLSGSTDAQG